MIGESVPIRGGDAFAQVLADMERRIAELERAGQRRRTQAGTSVVTTNASGDATITFPIGYRAAPAVVAGNGDTSTVAGMIVGVNSVTATTVTVRCYYPGGAVVGSATVRVNWVAVGA